jgi:polar amino acid transport system permease protein
VLLAALSTAVVGTLLGVLITGAPGWDRVRQSFFDPQIARDQLPDILQGLWLNIRLFVVCAVCALAIGLAIAVLRTLRGPVFFPVRVLATGYTYLFRGLPLIITIYLFAFGIPGLRLQGTPNVTVLGGAAIAVSMQKDVGLISLAGPIDAIRAAQIGTAETANFTPYVVAGVLFVLFALPLIGITDWVTLRAARRQNAGT